LAGKNNLKGSKYPRKKKKQVNELDGGNNTNASIKGRTGVLNCTIERAEKKKKHGNKEGTGGKRVVSSREKDGGVSASKKKKKILKTHLPGKKKGKMESF